MDIAILTPIEVEYRAVRKHLQEIQTQIAEGNLYEYGTYCGKSHRYEIVIRQTGSKNTDISLATEKAIRHFNPAIVLLVGIAGGVKDVYIGDVVVGTKAYGYESGKVINGSLVSRPEVLPYDATLIEYARLTARQATWQQKIAASVGIPQVVFGPIASGDKVVASTQSDTYAHLKTHFNDTVALEMEAIGFAKAVLPYKHIRALNIRGISDLLDHKAASDASGTQAVAATYAAAFAFEFLYDLDFSQVKLNFMDTKTLAKEVVTLLFPLLKLDSVKQIGSEFKTATNTSILELWQKVKPIFIEEIDKVGEDITDPDTQNGVKGAIHTNILSSLKKDENLRDQLRTLLQKEEMKPQANTIHTATHSENVLQGNQITVGGNFRVGNSGQNKNFQ